MTVEYKKYGVTTGGYRGERAILEERVIEGFEEASFNDSVLLLDANSPQTIHLTSDNTGEGYYIVLPNAQTLWKNWQVAIINDSSYEVKIYYYNSDLNELSLFKSLTSGNMTTCILLNTQTSEGTWTTLRTTDQVNAQLLNRYTSNVFEEIELSWNELQQEDSDESDEETNIKVSLGTVLKETSIRSIYLKTIEQFTFDSDQTGTLAVTVGTDSESDHFITSYTLTNTVADNNFTKDYFEEILSTEQDQEIFAYFTGTNLLSLTAGKVKIVVEKAKLIDPTVLQNPILQTQLPIGVIMNYAFSTLDGEIPDGFWRLDGSIWPNAAASIPQFVQKLNYTNNRLTEKLIVTKSEWDNINNTYGSCGKFCWVGGGLRFPKISNFIQGLTSLTDLGKLTPAGLPDITGTFNCYEMGGSTGNVQGTGAFYHAGRANRGTTNAQGTAPIVGFDASRSSSIYGNSSTVQPESIKYPYIISVYNKIQNASQLIVDEIIEASVDKANITLNNLSLEGRTAITNACMPDYAQEVLFDNVQRLTYIQVAKNSAVYLATSDPYIEDYRILVSPDNGITNYVVGYRYDDVNGNTQATSFNFLVPAGWYFTSTAENSFGAIVRPLVGVN